MTAPTPKAVDPSAAASGSAEDSATGFDLALFPDTTTTTAFHQGVVPAFVDSGDQAQHVSDAYPLPVYTPPVRWTIAQGLGTVSSTPNYTAGDQVGAEMAIYAGSAVQWRIIGACVTLEEEAGFASGDLELVVIASDTTSFTSAGDNVALVSDTVIGAIIPLTRTGSIANGKFRHVAMTNGQEGCDVFPGLGWTDDEPTFIDLSCALRYKGAGTAVFTGTTDKGFIHVTREKVQ